MRCTKMPAEGVGVRGKETPRAGGDDSEPRSVAVRRTPPALAGNKPDARKRQSHAVGGRCILHAEAPSSHRASRAKHQERSRAASCRPGPFTKAPTSTVAGD